MISKLYISDDIEMLSGKPTGYNKKEVKSCIVLKNGIQGDTRGYKGHIKESLYRAVLHVDNSNYDRIKKKFNSDKFNSDKFNSVKEYYLGENIYTDSGFSESDVCIGDIYNIGDAKLQVSMGRIPCSKVDAYNDTKGLCRYIEKTVCTGWFYSVLKEGEIKVGDNITLEQRSNPEYTVEKVMKTIFNTKSSKEELENLLNISELCEPLKTRINKKLKKFL